MNAPVAIFRADAGPAIGTGHVVRCLTLADALAARGWQCAFACRADPGGTAPALVTGRFPLFEVPADAADKPAAMRARWPDGVALLVVDHYGWNVRQESACRPWARHILAIDDLADRAHDADALLDQTFGRSEADYAGRIGRHCRLFLGTAYALLRPDFAALRPAALERRQHRPDLGRILVNFGGSDGRNMTPRAIAGIKASGLDVSVDIVIGAASRNAGEVERAMQGLGPGSALHRATPAMAELMAAADLAIGANGISAWERCCLGLPALAVCAADNQATATRKLSASGAIRPLGSVEEATPQRVAAALREIAADRTSLPRMALAAAAICDGRGADRLADSLDVSVLVRP